MAIGRDTSFTWLGHAAVEVRTPGGKMILFDPWLGNPHEPDAGRHAWTGCDLLLVTHGHGDHMGDAVALAAPPAPRLAVHPRDEPVAGSRRLPGGADQVIGMNKGGTVEVGGPAGLDDRGGPLRRRLERDRRDDALPRRAGGLRRGAGERVPHLPRRRHGGLRRHGADPRPVPAGPRAAADRRALHDGPGRRPRWPRSCWACATSLPIHWGTFPILAGTPAALRGDRRARGLAARSTTGGPATRSADSRGSRTAGASTAVRDAKRRHAAGDDRDGTSPMTSPAGCLRHLRPHGPVEGTATAGSSRSAAIAKPEHRLVTPSTEGEAALCSRSTAKPDGQAGGPRPDLTAYDRLRGERPTGSASPPGPPLSMSAGDRGVSSGPAAPRSASAASAGWRGVVSPDLPRPPGQDGRRSVTLAARRHRGAAATLPLTAASIHRLRAAAGIGGSEHGGRVPPAGETVLGRANLDHRNGRGHPALGWSSEQTSVS